ncbi:MAG: hypothetical protein AB7W47_17420 [Calditrichaceae bacterium]
MRMIVDPQIEVPQYPKISEDCHLIVDDKKIQIYGVEDSILLTGENTLPTVKKILPLLNGKNSLDYIVHSVSEKEMDFVPLILKYLYMKGLFEDYSTVREEDIIKSNEAQKYFSRLIDVTRHSKNRFDLFQKIKTYKIQLIINSELGISLYNEIKSIGYELVEIIALTEMKEHIVHQEGVIFFDSIDEINFNKEAHLICVFDRNYPKIFKKINKIAYSNKQMFTIAFLTDKKAIIGPTFLPDETGCFECYEQRQIMNTNDLDSFLTYKNFLNKADTVPFSHTNYNKKILVGILTAEIVNASTYITIPQTVGNEIEFDFIHLNLTKRKFHRLPVCKTCSKKIRNSNFAFTGV